jgi:aminoglycoside phosphotransferase (APT) family kinase protein
MEATRTPGARVWPNLLAAGPTLARRRARTALRRIGRSIGLRRRWVAALAPKVVAAREPNAGHDWITEDVAVTDTAVMVAVVRCRTSGSRRVVKLPCTVEGAAGLRRQAQVLAALHADVRLGDWLGVVPRPRAHGEIAGHSFWIEEAVPGTPVPERSMRVGADAVVAAAVNLIEGLHSRTAEHRTVGPTDIAEWIDWPLHRLAAFYAVRSRPGRPLAALRRLGIELSGELAHRTVRTSWVHGDFWTGNVLITGNAVTGIVDWDRAESDQLPLHDLLHLTVFAKRARDGGELGDIVVRSLHHGLELATGVSAERLDGWLGGVPERIAVLLFWLRHVSLFIGSEGHGDNPDWIRRNVDCVLAEY